MKFFLKIKIYLKKINFLQNKYSFIKMILREKKTNYRNATNLFPSYHKTKPTIYYSL